jgi:selenocysteine lyase/cysteine desulfurase
VVSTERYCAAIDSATILVAVSDVQSTNGYRVNLAGLSSACRRAGAQLFVNATQSLGALRLDANSLGLDYIAAHGYKWLLSPRGAAWLYVKPERIPAMRPLTPNWKNVPEPYAEYYGGPMELSENASRLDVSLGWFSWVGARAALQLLAMLDSEAIERRALDLAASFREQAVAHGFRLSPEEQPSHLLGVVVADPQRLAASLVEQRVIAAVRGGFLRLGFHGFNNEEDVDAALKALAGADAA